MRALEFMKEEDHERLTLGSFPDIKDGEAFVGSWYASNMVRYGVLTIERTVTDGGIVFEAVNDDEIVSILILVGWPEEIARLYNV